MASVMAAVFVTHLVLSSVKRCVVVRGIVETHTKPKRHYIMNILKCFFSQFSHFCLHGFVVAVVSIEMGMPGQGIVIMGQTCLVTGIINYMNRWRRWTNR